MTSKGDISCLRLIITANRSEWPHSLVSVKSMHDRINSRIHHFIRMHWVVKNAKVRGLSRGASVSLKFRTTFYHEKVDFVTLVSHFTSPRLFQ